MPTTLERILWVEVNEIPFVRTFKQQARLATAGVFATINVSGGGWWYEDYDSAGIPQIGLYPPAGDGLSLNVIENAVPPDFSPTQEPVTPQRFDRYISAFAISLGYNTLEDDPDLGTGYAQSFQAGVDELIGVRDRRFGSEPFSIGVEGITA